MDYVLDGIFERLSPKAQAMFTVVEHARAFKDDKRRLKNQLFPNIKTLAKHAHLSRTYSVYALKELEQWGIITREHRHGHSTLYTYIPANDNPKLRDGSVRIPDHQAVRIPDHQSVRLPDHRTTVSEQIERTTTDTWLTDYLFSKALKRHGREWTDVVVDRISKMNGKIRDKGAYFNWCITTKIIPDSEELRVMDAKAKHLKFVEEEAEKKRKEQEEKEKAFAESDPEVAKTEIAKMMEMFK